MNGLVGLLTATLLPGVIGFAWLQRLWRQAPLSARLGYGYLLGVLLTVLILQAWNSIGQRLSFPPLALILGGMALIPLWLKKAPDNSASLITPEDVTWVTWQRALWWFLWVLLAIRFGGLLMEVILRPLYPWDAWMNWAPKARTWFELKYLAPFVEPAKWPEMSRSIGAYTLGNPEASTYPPLVPLIQLWSALGLGEWRDNLINLPWWMVGMALTLAVYGQLRLLNVHPLTSMLVVYLISSMPYMNTHIALAGYADIWIAAYYMLAVMAIINWNISRSPIQFWLILLFALGCIMTKKPGMIWAATLITGLVVAGMRGRSRYIVPVGIFLVVLAGTLGLGIEIPLPDGDSLILSRELIQIPSLGNFTLEYHPVGQYFIENALLRGNWHLLGWLLAILIWPFMFRSLMNWRLLPGFSVAAMGMSFIIVVFFFTKHYHSAVDSTTLNRAILHFLPAFFYIVLSVFLIESKGRATIFPSAALLRKAPGSGHS